MHEFGDDPNNGVRQARHADQPQAKAAQLPPRPIFDLGPVAEEIAQVVGDGCIVRQLDPESGQFDAVAAAHRDPRQRRQLAETLLAPALTRPRGGWLRQALASGRAMRIPPNTSDDVGLVEDVMAGDVIVVPLVSAQAVAVVVRDRASGPFGSDEHHELERIASSVGDPLPAGGEGDVGGSELVEATSAALWLTDGNGNTTYVNQSACQLVGLPAEQVVGVPISEFLSRPVYPPPKVFEGSIATVRMLMSAQGSERWVSATKRPLFDRSSNWQGTLHTLVDIHEQHLREAALRTRADSEQVLRCFAELLLIEQSREVLADQAVKLIADQFGAPMVALAAISREHCTLELVACGGTAKVASVEYWPGQLHLEEASPVWAAIDDGEPIVVRDFAGQTPYEPGPMGLAVHARSGACAPIAGSAGCIAVARPEVDAISDAELDLLTTTAKLLSTRWPSASLA